MKKFTILSNGTEWCYFCWKGAFNDRVKFFKEPIPYSGNRLLKKICQWHYVFRMKHLRILPFTSIWYKNIDRNLSINNKDENIVIFYDWNFLTKDFGFLKHLRRKHPGIKLIYLFSNIVKITGATTYHIIDDLNKQFDAVFAFDKTDAEKYHFLFSPLIYADPHHKSPKEHKYDLFYVGNAKDRLYQLHEIYEKAISEGLTCNFNIVGVNEEDQLHKGEISYNKILRYDEIISLMNESRCLVDAIQGGSTALTIKTCEAVMYDKKLITTNQNVTKESFFKTGNIMVYDKTKSLKDFIDKPFVPYTKEDKAYFSPEELFRKIDIAIEERTGSHE